MCFKCFMSIKKSSKLINQSITSINQLIIILSLFYNQPLQPLHFKQSVNPAAVLTGVQGGMAPGAAFMKAKRGPPPKRKDRNRKEQRPRRLFWPRVPQTPKAAADSISQSLQPINQSVTTINLMLTLQAIRDMITTTVIK